MFNLQQSIYNGVDWYGFNQVVAGVMALAVYAIVILPVVIAITRTRLYKAAKAHFCRWWASYMPAITKRVKTGLKALFCRFLVLICEQKG